MSLSYHIKRFIPPDSEVTLSPIRMINYDSDTECKSDAESDSEVNVSYVVPISG